jgi:magnesium chelatase accessory protein
MTPAPALGDRIGIAPAGGASVPRGEAVEAGRSSYVHSGAMRWHLRTAGQGPRLLLLHGTGSASGSWNRLASILAAGFKVLAPDLPGHGLSGILPAGRMGLDAYASALSGLVADLRAWPELIVGHSAGAAIAARMALDRRSDRTAVLSINGALRPLSGWTWAMFVPIARLLAIHPFVPALVASRVASDPRAVRRLLDSTGSRIDDGMVAHYEQLMRSPAHLAGTLRMLAHWDLHALARQLHRLGPRLTLVAADCDRTVPPQDAGWVQARVPDSALWRLPGLGHLAHEEAPEAIARIVVAVANTRGLAVAEAPARGRDP